MKKTWILITLITLLMLSCQTSEEKVDLTTFSEMYKTIQLKFKKQLNQPDVRKNFVKIVQEKNEELEKLLKRSKAVPYSEEREIIKSKIFIHLRQYEKAEGIINPVLFTKTGFINEAKLVKIQILLARQKSDKALNIFREIESEVKRDQDFFSTCLYFALKGKDIMVREEYCNKILNAKDLPAEFNIFKARIYSSLAAVAYRKNELYQSKILMKKAITMASNPMEKHMFTSRLSQLELIGKPAPSLSAETWLNSPALSLNNLKGKLIIIDFWATWCTPCRDTIPLMVELYQKYSRKNLIIIGFTKLYGMYRDGIENRNEVDKAEEISLIKKFVSRQKIPYPIAISDEGQDHMKYFVTGIPAIVFINTSGNIAHIQLGSSEPEQLREKIKELMEN
ncbi:MAG: TlpA family protein disulfide reductase [Candidatus Aminicenantes bacterium]|nr:TlpA family protein disulfide reductase [Candidatus Aminicenantes bacterium]